MTLFVASLHNELRKLLARKKYLVLLIIEAVICLGCVGITALLNKMTGGMAATSFFLGSMQLSLLGFFVLVYIPLVIFMAACDLFAGEFHDGTIRATFMRPVSRGKQYFSKIAAILIAAVVYLLVLLVLTTIIKIAGTGSAVGVLESFASYLLDVLPMVVLVLFAAMMNQITNSPSLSVVICIIIYIGLILGGIFIPQISGHLFTGYLQWHNLWMGITLPFRAMITKMGILLGYGLIFGGVGYYLFERKEM